MVALHTRLGDRSLKNDVCAEIVRMLHRGELCPGDRISEAVIASRLGISRSPVREAFVQLAHEGVIVRKPRSGNFIASRSDRELSDLQETRVLIESFAARVVCLTFDEQHERELSEVIGAMATTVGTSDWLEGSRLNAQFHQTVVRMTGNASLERLWKTLDPLAWLLAPWAITSDSMVQQDIVERHQALLESLASGDSHQASSAFANHIINATVLVDPRPPRFEHALAAADGSGRH